MQFGGRVNAMKASALFAIFFRLVIVAHQAATGQQPPENDKEASALTQAEHQPSALANQNEMEDWLIEDGKTEDRLVGIGVDRKVAQAFVSADKNRTLFPDWTFARTGGKSRVGVLFLPCNWEELAYVYLVQYSDGGWRITDQKELDCHYDETASVEEVQIRNPNRDEIAIHHACEGHGTGYLEQSFSVFLPIRGKLKTELETDEVLHSFPTAVRVRHDLDQASTFTVIPVVGSNSRAIEETRSSTLNNQLIVQRRVFRWDAARDRYIASRFTKVEFEPAS